MIEEKKGKPINLKNCLEFGVGGKRKISCEVDNSVVESGVQDGGE